MIVPSAETADVAAVAAHYDELDELYRKFWGTALHHGFWITDRESPQGLTSILLQLARYYEVRDIYFRR